MKVWPIWKKEMRLYFTSPVAYVIMAIFLLLAGYFFYAIFAFFSLASMQSAMNPQMGRELNVTDSVMRPLLSNVSVILLLLMPLITMRLFAEERRSGTIELLLTYPVRDGAVLFGKYLAAFTLYLLTLACTLLAHRLRRNILAQTHERRLAQDSVVRSLGVGNLADQPRLHPVDAALARRLCQR